MQLTHKIEQSEAIFFDLFHTLFCFEVDGKKRKNTGEILGIPDKEWNRLLFDSSENRLKGFEKEKYEIIKNLAHQYDDGITDEVIHEAADYRHENFHNELSNYKTHRVDVIEGLKKKGIKIGLISNADAVEISGWYSSPFAPIFDSVVFSFEVGHMKPENEIYQHALESLGVSAENSIFVGDGSNRELWGAKQVGFTTVMTTEIIQHMWPEKIHERKVDADFVIEEFAQLNES